MKKVQVPSKTMKLVLEFFAGDRGRVRLWLTTSNPMLGGISPNDMISRGRGEKLHRFVEQAMEACAPPHE